MGVNVQATLSPKADWQTVGEVASILLGAKAYSETISNGGYSSFEAARVEGFTFKSYKSHSKGSPELIDIVLKGNRSNPVMAALEKSDGYPYRLWYNLEDRSLYPKCTAAKIALALGIVKFFGGRITYNDAEGPTRSFKTPRYIGAENGKPYDELQKAMLALKPLTQKDIGRVRKYAAYDVEVAG